MRLQTLSLIVLLVLTYTSYQSRIKRLSESNLEQFSKDNSYWLIQISQGRCPLCSQQQAELEQLALVLEGAVKIGKIDAKLIPSLKIQKSPTYIFTRSDAPQNSKPYEGKFNKKELTEFCLEQLSVNFKARQNKKPDSSQQSSKSNSKKSSSDQKLSSQSSSPSNTVIQLNDKQFQQKVLKSSDAWLVQFYSPGCGHCKNFEPQYSKLPKLIGKRVHISRIDGSKNQQYMGKYQVKGFPTVLLFDTENKDTPIPYSGQRTAEAVTQWLKTQNLNEQKRDVLQLTRSNYIQQCNKNIVCLIFILNKKSEKSKLGFLAETLVEQSNRPIRFFYSERLDQFENQLMINDRDCPKMVSVWDSINSYRIYNGEMNHDSLSSFLKTVLERRGWIKYQRKLVDSLFEKTGEL